MQGEFSQAAAIKWFMWELSPQTRGTWTIHVEFQSKVFTLPVSHHMAHSSQCHAHLLDVELHYCLHHRTQEGEWNRFIVDIMSHLLLEVPIFTFSPCYSWAIVTYGITNYSTGCVHLGSRLGTDFLSPSCPLPALLPKTTQKLQLKLCFPVLPAIIRLFRCHVTQQTTWDRSSPTLTRIPQW